MSTSGIRTLLAVLCLVAASPAFAGGPGVCSGMMAETLKTPADARGWMEAGCDVPEEWRRAAAEDDARRERERAAQKERDAVEAAKRSVITGRFGDLRDDPHRRSDGKPHPVFPRRKGQCITSKLTFVGGTDEAATGAQLANGATFAFYGDDDFVPALQTAARGGHILRICYGGPPPRRHADGTPCPKGDHRGTSYNVTDTATGAKFSLSEDLHVCGGA